MRKKFLALLGICLIVSSSVTAYAQTDSFIINGEEHTYVEIAELTGLDAVELQKFAETNPKEFYEDALKLFNNDISPSSSQNSPIIGMIHYNSLNTMVREEGKKGYFLISATNHTEIGDIIDYRHGHAGLLYTPASLLMIHAPGPGKVSQKVTVRSMTTLSDSEMKMRLYRVQGASDTTATRAANYANSNLIGLAYDFDSKVTDSTVNCATLIWKAYNSQGISLNKFFYTVTPESLVQDHNTIGVATVNWQGDQNSFDLIQTSSYSEEAK